MAQGGGPQAVLCRYYMSNVCNKGDQCRFSHDPSVAQPSMVCRYFLKGTCAYGDKCRYQHSFPEGVRFEHAWPEYMGTGKVGETDGIVVSPTTTTTTPATATTTLHHPPDTDMKTKKLILEQDTHISSHQQPNMVNISSVNLSGGGLTPVLTRVTPVPPPPVTAPPLAVPPANTAALIPHHHPQVHPQLHHHPHHPQHPAAPAQVAQLPQGYANAQEMMKHVTTSMTQFVAMILEAHRVPHSLQTYKSKRSMTVEDARNSAQNLLTYVIKLGAALCKCVNMASSESFMELWNLLLRFWAEAKEPCPDLSFTYQDLHQMALLPEGRHLLENTLNQLQYFMATLKSILNQQ